MTIKPLENNDKGGTEDVVYLEIRAGEGGDDAVLFGEELAGAFTSYAHRRGARVVRRGERTIVLEV